MRDTRKEREALVVLFSAGLGAVIGQVYLSPWIGRRLNVRKKAR